MVQNYWYIFSFILFFSCNNPSKKKHNINNKSVEQIAEDFYKEDKYLEAKQSYDKLISIDSSQGKYYNRRAYCNAVLGDFEEAKRDYLKTIALNNVDKKNVYLSLGMLYRFNKEYDSAIYFYNESLKLDSNFLKAKDEKREVNSMLKVSK